MRGMMRLAIMGVPGAQGGASLLPFSDNFDRADGDLGGDWEYTSGVWTISSGAVTSNPAVGENIVTNGDMETGDPPTGYNAVFGATLSSQADERTGGAGAACLQIARGTSDVAATKSATITAKQFYRGGIWARCVTALNAGFPFGFMSRYNISGDWLFCPGFGYDNDTSWAQVFYTSGAEGVTARYDDYTIQQVTRADLFATQDYGTPNVRASVKLSNVTQYPAGVVLCADDAANPQSFVLAIISPNTFHATGLPNPMYGIYKFVAGVMSTLDANKNIPYEEGGTLALEYSGGVVRLFYEGEQLGVDYAAADAEIINNTRHGMFNADSSNILEDFNIKVESPILLNGSSSAIFERVTVAANLWTASGTDDWLGRPSMADLGTHWVTTYITGTNHSTAANIHIRFTDDEAANWTAEDTSLDAAAVTCPGHMATAAPDGSLLVFWKDETGATCFRSTDGGKTFGDVIRVNSVAGCMVDETFVYGSRIYACVIDWTVSEWPTLHLYISDNNGLAWSLLADMPTNEGGNEWTVATLDGTNMVAIKREWGGTNTLISHSSNGGTTWTDWASMDDFGVVQKPTLRALAGGYMLVGRDGKMTVTAVTPLVMFSNDGVRWGRKFHPDSGSFNDAAYCAVLEKSDGNYYMLSYGGTTAAASIRDMVFGITE